MSMDYDDFLRIRDRSRWLGRVWRVGDCGYYLGLLGACGAFFSMTVATVVVGGGCRLLGGHPEVERWWRALPFWLIGMPVGAAVLFGSACLKRFARRRSGIEQ